MSFVFEAAPQPSNFTANFEIKILGIKVTSTDSLSNIIRTVEWRIFGTEGEHTVMDTRTTELGAPDPDSFVALDNVMETNVKTWIETTDMRIPGIKHGLQMRLDELKNPPHASVPMPWAPEPESEEPAPPSPAAATQRE